MLEEERLPRALEHVVVLVHGMNSSPRSLKLLQEQLEIVPGMRVINDDCSTGLQMTTDGIVAGGKRLAELVANSLTGPAALSFVGVSLGGLYARYCIGELGKRLREEKGVVMLNYVSFVTPHLGLRGLLPMLFDGALRVAGGLTGKELLLADDDDSGSSSLLKQLAEGSFLRELSMFKRRVMIGATQDVRVPMSSAFADFLSCGSGTDEFSMACDLRALGWSRLVVDYREGLVPWFTSHSALHRSKDVLGTLLDRLFYFDEISDVPPFDNDFTVSSQHGALEPLL